MSAIVRSTCLVLAALIALGATPSRSFSAEFESERSVEHEAWSVHLFRNLKSNRRFCALQTMSSETVLRVNRYRDSGEAFLEIYNPTWTMMEGGVRFNLVFEIKNEEYSADFAGRSWGDSYTHDFTDVKIYEVILGMISQSRSVTVTNSNGTLLANFPGRGSFEAVNSYYACVGQEEPNGVGGGQAGTGHTKKHPQDRP